ncbi:MAG: long-chain fatty acid--CoA ligase [Hydrogenophaga sp.]|uniref:long-chain fatty acid--CoA ligase n=1 Tax=Hydrogenophaga sp. TaxID=1904254 RepID=UPI001DC8700A|nr:long-chain fatty acid--CoA ligase [Hydrogenophaga sp.]MBX3610590.1 long-chain fatty acid--CoA ligase [Hydrogenophaga sp.]
MNTAPHHSHWPAGLPHHLTLPETSLWFNAEVSARRYPDKPYIVYYDTPLSFGQFRDQAECLAGHLQQVCGVKAGDRVLLYLQNSPQWVIGYYAILRANAVVVPVNPMNMTEELAHYVADSGASVAITAQDLLPQLLPLHRGHGGSSDRTLVHVVVATYSDYLQGESTLRLPPFVTAPRQPVEGDGLHAWSDVLAARPVPEHHTVGPDDLCVMPYTSGTTGHPKGCMHTHRSVQCTAIGGMQWFARSQDAVMLSVLPFFHVTGMAGGMNGPLYLGATIVVMSRWDRETAAELMQRHGVTSWQAISTMVVDFLANPRIGEYDLSRLVGIRGGGAAMPAAVAHKLKQLLGLDYVEGYGMSETMAATHINPPQRPKPQCLGIPVFDVDARVIDPQTLQELPAGETGEIVVHAPQVMQGYWRNDAATAEAFIDLAGRRFLRTGDLARIDEDGYFFMMDRLKRMINASGYKVWPAEVETLMYQHPAILEVCVIGALDAKRGETVKAVVVLKPEQKGQVSEGDIIEWSHQHMAAYKSPRIVEFTNALPKSGTGKIMWRHLQEQQSRIDSEGVRA